jgi:hypothetical protein
LEPETKPSLSARISSVLRHLGEILVSFWAFVVSMFSKLRAPRSEVKGAVSQKNDTGKKRKGSPKPPPVIAEVMPTPPPDEKPEKCRYQHTPWWKTTAEMLGIAAVVVYTVFSGFQMHYAHQQAVAGTSAAQAATESLKTIKEQFQLDQRPYIAVINYETAKLNPFIKGKPIWVNIVFKNLGKSPAFNVTPHAHMLFISNVTQFRIEPPDTEKGSGIVDVGQEKNTTAISRKDPFNESILIAPSEYANWDGTQVIVFGRISYDDRFGNSYCTPYLAVSLGENGRNGPWYTSKILGRSASDLCPAGKY